MNLDIIQYCNRLEKVAILKLIIKVASADGTISEQEQLSIEEFLDISHLKTSPSFIEGILEEDITEVTSVFTSKSNLRAASKLIEEYAEQHSVHPELEGKVLEEIASKIETRKKEIKFSPQGLVNSFGNEFKTLWGQESMRPELKSVWALIFTLTACLLGSFWTDTGWLSSGDTKFLMPLFSGVISGLFIYGALSFRGYFPAPTNFRNILFSVADVYLLSILAQHLIGWGAVEKSFTLMIGGGLILLLWLGIKELLGFVLLAGCILVVYKIIVIDEHIAWRAFPLIITGFMGLVFQSKGLFSDFSSVSNSFLRTPDLDKELLKESLESAGSTIGSVVKIAGAVATGGSSSALIASGKLAGKDSSVV